MNCFGERGGALEDLWHDSFCCSIRKLIIFTALSLGVWHMPIVCSNASIFNDFGIYWYFLPTKITFQARNRLFSDRKCYSIWTKRCVAWHQLSHLTIWRTLKRQPCSSDCQAKISVKFEMPSKLLPSHFHSAIKRCMARRPNFGSLKTALTVTQKRQDWTMLETGNHVLQESYY